MSDFIMNYIIVPLSNETVARNVLGNMLLIIIILAFVLIFLNPMFTKWTVDKFNVIVAYLEIPQFIVFFSFMLYWYVAVPVTLILFMIAKWIVIKEQKMFLELEKIGIIPNTFKKTEDYLKIYELRKDELSKMVLNRKIIRPKVKYIILIAAVEFSAILLYCYLNDCKYLLIPIQKF